MRNVRTLEEKDTLCLEAIRLNGLGHNRPAICEKIDIPYATLRKWVKETQH